MIQKQNIVIQTIIVGVLLIVGSLLLLLQCGYRCPVTVPFQEQQQHVTTTITTTSNAITDPPRTPIVASELSSKQHHDHALRIQQQQQQQLQKEQLRRQQQQQQNVIVGDIIRIRLINANTDTSIRTIINGTQINLYQLPTDQFNLVADISGMIASVQFIHGVNSTSHTIVDTVAPYTLCGEQSQVPPLIDYNACSTAIASSSSSSSLGVGRHAITATPRYNGISGRPYTITFTIINRLVTPRNCVVPRFVDTTWKNFDPGYPIKNGEPQGLLVGNDIVIFSGFQFAFTVATNRTYARDVTSSNSVWRRMDDMPLPSGITHMATVHVGPVVYLCGGYYGPHPGPHTNICFKYDHSIAPGRGAQWTYMPNLPNGGTAGGGMVYNTARNTLYYAGGGQRLTPGSIHPVDVQNTWKLNLNDLASTWVASTPIPYAANHLSYVTHRDSVGNERHFMLAGQIGENETSGNLAFNYEFIPSTETWIQRASMPIARGHAASSTRAIGCGFVIAGGTINDPNGTNRRVRTDDVSYYDIYNDRWTTAIGTLPWSGATPIVDIHSNGYMHFVNAVPISDRRRISA